MIPLSPFRILAIITALIFTAGLSAQETTVYVKVKKDGKVVKDTTYSFEDEEQAENALKMMDVMCGGDEQMVEIHKTVSEGHEGHAKTMVFISEDGKSTQIETISGDSVVWIAEGGNQGDDFKEARYKMEFGDDFYGEHVVVLKSDDGETYHVIIDEKSEGDDGGESHVKTKEIKVVISGEEGSEWSVKENDSKADSEKENVEVIVVEKEVKK